MLTDQVEIDLVQNAWEPGIRDPHRRAGNFERVIKRFLGSVRLEGSVVADMGPGHYDFGKAMAQRGAKTIGLELDPAVIALGRHRGFEVIEFDLRKDLVSERLGKASIDGLYCNGSINCSWWPVEADHHAYVADILAALKPDGWAYIAPCNASGSLSIEEAGRDPASVQMIKTQISAFEAHGFRTIRMNRYQQGAYGVSTNMHPRVVFTKGLRYIPGPW